MVGLQPCEVVEHKVRLEEMYLGRRSGLAAAKHKPRLAGAQEAGSCSKWVDDECVLSRLAGFTQLPTRWGRRACRGRERVRQMFYVSMQKLQLYCNGARLAGLEGVILADLPEERGMGTVERRMITGRHLGTLCAPRQDCHELREVRAGLWRGEGWHGAV